MSLVPISLTTTGSQGEVLATAPANRQYEVIFLSAFKDSAYTLNISRETAKGFQTIFTETVSGGTIVTDDPILLNSGEKLVSQSSTPGINIYISFKINSAV